MKRKRLIIIISVIAAATAAFSLYMIVTTLITGAQEQNVFDELTAIVEQQREIGVDSFWYKEAQQAPMLEVMDRTMAGEHIFPDRPPSTNLGMAQSTDFTERELDVLRLLSEGMTDKEIADNLFLSVTTVRYHINNLISKTGFGSRTELAVNAVRSGIAIPGLH